MSEDSLFNKVAKVLIIGLPLLTIFYCILIEGRFVYYWDVFWPVYRRILYLFSIFIPLGLLFIYFFSKNHFAFKILGFVFTIPLFCLGSLMLISASPAILDVKELNNYTYYLFAEDEPLKPRTFIRLLICKTNTFACSQTSFEERADITNNSYFLMIDPNKNEVHVLAESQLYGNVRLQYTYGAYPRHYDLPEQLGNNLYYLAVDYASPGAHNIYTLYECKLDHTLCDLLPFEYQGSGGSIKIQADQFTNEVNVYLREWDSDKLEYKEKVLIYVYDENPRCFVEGCEILEQQ